MAENHRLRIDHEVMSTRFDSHGTDNRRFQDTVIPRIRTNHMPEINVEILPGDGTPTGVGEPGTTPIAPAVANALYAATGKRLRSMPFNKHGMDMA